MAHGAKWNIHMHKWILQKHHNKSLIPKIPCVRTVNSSFGFSFCLYYILLIACVIWCEWSSAGRWLGRAGQVKVSHWRFMRSVWLYENSRLYENSWMRLPLKWVKMGTFPWRRANTGGWRGCCDTEGGLGVVTRDCVTPWPAPTLLHITAVFTHSWQRRGHSPLVIKLNVHSHPRRGKNSTLKNYTTLRKSIIHQITVSLKGDE